MWMLSGVICCQLMENHLDNAASQLEFLSEIKDGIGKSAVSNLIIVLHLIVICIGKSAVSIILPLSYRLIVICIGKSAVSNLIIVLQTDCDMH